MYSKIGGIGVVRGELITRSYRAPPPLPKPPAATFASQGDDHLRTDAQIKFLYYPLTV